MEIKTDFSKIILISSQTNREKEFGWWLLSLVFGSLDYIVSNVGWVVYLKACLSNVYI